VPCSTSAATIPVQPKLPPVEVAIKIREPSMPGCKAPPTVEECRLMN
jgi:hypothetical protein